MADWTWTTASALTAQTWAKKWWIEAKSEEYFNQAGYIGTDPENSYIVEFPDLEKEQGYKHTFGQVRNLTGAGVTGDADMEGNEESPNVYDDAIEINQKRNAIRTAGKLSEQYPSDKAAREWATVLLKRWMADMMTQDIFTALGTSPTKIIYGGDATATTDIEAGDYMTLSLIGKAWAYSMKATPKIKGKMVKGKETFVCVMPPDCVYDVSERDAAWAQAQREAAQRGPDNPIFGTSLGVYRGVALQSHERAATAVTWGSGANLAGGTALFLGVGAAGLAYAKRKVWNEKTFDLIHRSFTQGCVSNNGVNSGEAHTYADDYEVVKAA